MPIRPAAWVALVAELESRDVRPPGSLNHAGLLIGGATYLYRRHMPATLRPPLCRVQEIPQYADARSFELVAEDTQLLVFNSCTVSDVWRDRDIIRKQLELFDIVFLCNDPRADDGQSAAVARRLGVDRSGVRPFYVVTNRELQEVAETGVEVAASARSLHKMAGQLADVRAFQAALRAGRGQM